MSGASSLCQGQMVLTYLTIVLELGLWRWSGETEDMRSGLPRFRQLESTPAVQILTSGCPDIDLQLSWYWPPVVLTLTSSCLLDSMRLTQLPAAAAVWPINSATANGMADTCTAVKLMFSPLLSGYHSAITALFGCHSKSSMEANECRPTFQWQSLFLPSADNSTH